MAPSSISIDPIHCELGVSEICCFTHLAVPLPARRVVEEIADGAEVFPHHHAAARAVLLTRLLKLAHEAFHARHRVAVDAMGVLFRVQYRVVLNLIMAQAARVIRVTAGGKQFTFPSIMLASVGRRCGRRRGSGGGGGGGNQPGRFRSGLH